MSSAQRRPGSRPRRHALPLVAPVLADLAQRRPGSRPRRHTVSRWRRSAGSATLNEGRGRDPGDTAVAGIRVRPVGSAQRRPGSRPRRHVNAQAFAAVVWTAQRRPGSRPRRHSTASIRFTSPGPRSTKAGVETPATRLRHGGHRARCDRSTKAGVETPATPTESRRSAPIQKVAQRRPGSRPRRHLIGLPPVFKYDLRAQRRPGSRPRRHDAVRRPGSAGMYARSTKAGVETPATPVAVLPHVVCPSAALNEGRGRDPGDTTRNGGIIGFGGVRSTKAGVETPATRSIGPQPGSPRHSLNEGRGRDPGDTRHTVAVAPRSTKDPGGSPAAWAQRRPGSRPRRHTPAGTSIVLVETSATRSTTGDPSAQRRPGSRPRRHPTRSGCQVSR